MFSTDGDDNGVGGVDDFDDVDCGDVDARHDVYGDGDDYDL